MSTFDGIIKEYPLICIDSFQHESNFESTVYFLSHCHTDHMQGISSINFHNHLRSRGFSKIYVSDVSENILKNDRMRLHLSDFLVSLPLEEPTTITIYDQDGHEHSRVVVTLLTAGHCPGSVMFYIEGNNGRVLYTGDFRLPIGGSARLPYLHEKSGSLKKLDSLYVDTTFCKPQCMNIPSREDCLKSIISLVRPWLCRGPNHIICFIVSAGINYEYLFVELHKLFGEKTHVTAEKFEQYKGIKIIEDVVTYDPREARIHACIFDKRDIPPGQVEYFPEYLCGYCTNDYKTIRVRQILLSTMFFVNTRYSGIAKKVDKEKYRACFSAHSSLAEVKDMVQYLKPSNVYPNVVKNQTVEEILSLINPPQICNPSFEHFPPLGPLKRTAIDSVPSSNDSIPFYDECYKIRRKHFQSVNQPLPKQASSEVLMHDEELISSLSLETSNEEIIHNLHSNVIEPAPIGSSSTSLKWDLPFLLSSDEENSNPNSSQASSKSKSELDLTPQSSQEQDLLKEERTTPVVPEENSSKNKYDADCSQSYQEQDFLLVNKTTSGAVKRRPEDFQIKSSKNKSSTYLISQSFQKQDILLKEERTMPLVPEENRSKNECPQEQEFCLEHEITTRVVKNAVKDFQIQSESSKTKSNTYFLSQSSQDQDFFKEERSTSPLEQAPENKHEGHRLNRKFDTSLTSLSFQDQDSLKEERMTPPLKNILIGEKSQNMPEIDLTLQIMCEQDVNFEEHKTKNMPEDFTKVPAKISYELDMILSPKKEVPKSVSSDTVEEPKPLKVQHFIKSLNRQAGSCNGESLNSWRCKKLLIDCSDAEDDSSQTSLISQISETQHIESTNPRSGNKLDDCDQYSKDRESVKTVNHILVTSGSSKTVPLSSNNILASTSKYKNHAIEATHEVSKSPETVSEKSKPSSSNGSILLEKSNKNMFDESENIKSPDISFNSQDNSLLGNLMSLYRISQLDSHNKHDQRKCADVATRELSFGKIASAQLSIVQDQASSTRLLQVRSHSEGSSFLKNKSKRNTPSPSIISGCRAESNFKKSLDATSNRDTKLGDGKYVECIELSSSDDDDYHHSSQRQHLISNAYFYRTNYASPSGGISNFPGCLHQTSTKTTEVVESDSDVEIVNSSPILFEPNFKTRNTAMRKHNYYSAAQENGGGQSNSNNDTDGSICPLPCPPKEKIDVINISDDSFDGMTPSQVNRNYIPLNSKSLQVLSRQKSQDKDQSSPSLLATTFYGATNSDFGSRIGQSKRKSDESDNFVPNKFARCTNSPDVLTDSNIDSTPEDI